MKAKNIYFKKSFIMGNILLLIIVSILFSYTMRLRKPWLSSITNEKHQWLTGSSMKFINNWLDESPLKLKYGMLENPKSLEFTDLESRMPYPSYPPGAIIPIYLSAKLLNFDEVTPEFIMKYNLLNHFLSALLLAWLVFYFLQKLGRDFYNSLIMAIIPIIIFLFNPENLYFFQNVYFSDQAIILPFILFIFIEMIHLFNECQEHKFLRYLQIIVMFYGALTDWLFFFVVLVVWLVRVIRKEFGNKVWTIIQRSFLFWLPYIIVISLFLIQLNDLGVITYLKYKFLCRTGIDKVAGAQAHNFFNHVWMNHFINGYGYIAFILFWLGVAFFIFSFISLFINKDLKNNKVFISSLSLMTYALLPCIMQLYFFKNHSVIHRFSVQKIAVALSFMPVFIKVISCNIFFPKINQKSVLPIAFPALKPRLCVSILILLLLVFIKSNQSREFYTNIFPENSAVLKEIGLFVKNNTGFHDIVFSYEIEAPCNPPVLLAYSQKRIYKISSLADVYDKIENIAQPFNVDFLISKNSPGLSQKIKSQLKVSSICENDKYLLYKVKHRDFLENWQIPGR